MRYRVEPLPRDRLGVIDLLDMTRFASRYTVHGLIEADVTDARSRLGRLPEGSASLTSFVVACLARAVRQHPEVNARRAGRRLVLFDDVDIVVTVERRLDGGPAPTAWRIRNGHEKSVAAIHAELETARTRRLSEPDPDRLMTPMRLPRMLRRPAVRLLSRSPRGAATLGPPIGVSSLGMFGAGWGIPLSPVTLMVTVGGISRRPVLGPDGLNEREMLPLTLSFDHSVIDGAPAARFAMSFRAVLERAAALDGPDTSETRSSTLSDLDASTSSHGAPVPAASPEFPRTRRASPGLAPQGLDRT